MESAAGSTLGVTVFCVILGSSSVQELMSPGKKLRWAALILLAILALWMAWQGRRTGPGRWPLTIGGLAAWFTAVALVSTAWSVEPRLTFGRGVSFALLMTAAGALAIAARGRPTLPRALVLGVLVGTTAAALVGLAMLVFAHADAVQMASDAAPARFRGFGQNPDTMAMLEGICVPIALWALIRARSNVARGGLLATLLLLIGSISASGSRGGLLAALVGGLVLSATLRAPVRQRLVVALSVVLAIAAAAAGTRIPKPLPYAAPGTPGYSGTAHLAPPGQPVGGSESQYAGRLTDELYRVQSGSRSLFTSTGRLQAWYTAVEQADARPLLGYGFGTEERVFIDRVYNFDGSYTENSFVGMYLQLGLVGALSLLAVLAGIGAAAFLAIRSAPADGAGPVLFAVFAAGIALMLVQSYVYSVGNVATVAFWVSSFLVASCVQQASASELVRPIEREGAVAAG